MIERVKKTAILLLEDNLTIRKVAEIIGISKSTVHKDLTERLPYIDYSMYEDVKKLLDYNKQIRHIRGGLSTKKKYSKNNLNH